MQREHVVFAMRNGVRILAGLCILTLTGVAAAQIGLWNDRGGLGLRPSNPEPAAFPGAPLAGQQPTSSRDYELYRGVREVPQAGSFSSESYSGVVYSLSRRWESSLEAGVVPESVSAPRRYSLAGQLGTALSGGHSVSVGLKFRHYDTASGMQPYGALTGGVGSGYALAPSALDSSYEVRLSYRYSVSGSFGLALGRDLETLAGPRFAGKRRAPAHVHGTALADAELGAYLRSSVRRVGRLHARAGPAPRRTLPVLTRRILSQVRGLSGARSALLLSP